VWDALGDFEGMGDNIVAEGCMESYWTVKEVAAALQISVQTVYRYVANGEIPFHKLTKAVRFKPSEIESWMENKKPDVMAAGHENLFDGSDV
jgi:excisionase family DNA binding protein